MPFHPASISLAQKRWPPDSDRKNTWGQRLTKRLGKSINKGSFIFATNPFGVCVRKILWDLGPPQQRHWEEPFLCFTSLSPRYAIYAWKRSEQRRANCSGEFLDFSLLPCPVKSRYYTALLFLSEKIKSCAFWLLSARLISIGLLQNELFLGR